MFTLFEIALSNAVVASLLAVLVVAAGRICRRPALTHSLWLLVLVKLLTPPIIQIPIAHLQTDRDEVAAVERQAGEGKETEKPTRKLSTGHGDDMNEWDHVSELADPSGVTEEPFIAAFPASMSPDERTPVAELKPAESLEIGADSAAVKEIPVSHLRAIVMPLLVFVWIAGSILVAMLAIVRIFRFQRLLKHGVAAPSWLRGEVERLGGRIGLKRLPMVVLVPERISPLVWSLGRTPRLILPEKLLARLEQQERETALLHELSHLRRRDHWVRFLELAAGCCYWWHPVVWWARREIQGCEEACCDAWVVWYSSGGGRPYANALLAMVDFLSDSRPVMPPVASGFGRFKSLKRRLTMILEGTTPRRLSGLGRLAVIVVAVCSLPPWPTVGVERTAEAETVTATDVSTDEGPDFEPSTAESETEQAQPKPETATQVSMPTLPEPTEFAAVRLALRFYTQRIRSVAFSKDGRLLAVAHGEYGWNGAVRVWDLQENKEIAFWRGPNGIVSVDISPDGRLVASSNHYGDNLVSIRSIASGKEILKIATGDKPTAVRFAPDGRTLATASMGGELRLWNVEDGKELTSLASLSLNLQCVAFSHDGTRIAAGGGPYLKDGFGWAGVWEIESGRQLAEMKDLPGSVWGVTFSPDGKLLATAGYDRLARLWQVETGELVSTLSGHRSVLKGIDFSPDGKMLATASYDATAKLWNVDSGQEVATLPGFDEAVMTTRFSPDGKTLVTAGREGVVRFWDVATREQTGLLEPDDSSRDTNSPVLSVACSPDGKTVASAHEDKTVRLRDALTGEFQRLFSGHQAEVSCIAFSPDNKMLATASCDNTVRLWDASSGKERTTLTGHTDWVLSVAFAPDGKTIASSGSDNTLRLWDVETGKEKAVLEGHAKMVRCLAFAPDGKMLASGSTDHTVKLWNVQSQTEVSTLKGRHGGTLAFSPDGKTLASVGEDGTIILREIETGNEQQMPNRRRGDIWCLAFSPRGRTLASGNSDGTITLWDPDSPARRGTLLGHSDIVTSLAFTPDTSAMISGSSDRTIKLWKSKGPQIRPIATLPVTDEGARCRFGFFSPDGRLMITAGDDKFIRVWDVQTGRLLRKDKYPGGTPICGDLSLDGRLLATGTYGNTVYLWGVATGRRVGKLITDEKKLLGVDFSPDGARLAVASGSKTVSVWDVESRQKRWVSAEQSLPVTIVVFSPDGKTLATTTGDWKKPEEPGEVKLWDADSGKELALLPFRGGHVNRARFSPDGERLVTSGSSDETLRIWDVKSRQLRSAIQGVGGTRSLTFLPGGKSVLAGQYGRGVSMWDIESGQHLGQYVFLNDSTPVLEVSYTPDGSLIAAASTDGTITLWPTMLPGAPPGASTSAERARTLIEAGKFLRER